MTVDQRVVMGFVNEVKEFEVKTSVGAPPIQLWKLGLILLVFIGCGTGAYYLTKG